MKRLYELLEDIRDMLTEKFIPNYSLNNVYKAVIYAIVYAALRRTHNNYELLKPLKQKIPLPILAAAKRKLVNKFYIMLNSIDSLITSERPTIVEGEANLKHVVEAIKYEIKNVDYVLAYDCMSIIEQLVISAFLRTKGLRSMFLSKVFLNPIGLTRFATQQLYSTGYRTTLSGVAQYIAHKLKASLYRKSSYIDVKVHEVGSIGIGTFVDEMPISTIAYEVLEKAWRGRTLVFSDHGYDIVISPKKDYLYITHGFKRANTSGGTPLLLLSRITFFIGIYRAR